MNSILKMFLLLSVLGTVLIIILFSFKPILKSKTNKQFQYYIWLIVIIRLLFPFYIEINLNKTNYIKTNDILTIQTNNVDNYTVLNDSNIQISENKTINLNKPVLSKNTINWVLRNLWLIWIVTAIIIIIRKITIYQSFIKYIKAGQMPVNDINILDKLSIISQELKVNKAIELCANPLISSPLLIGFFRPCIVLPSINISEIDLRYTLMHELVHYKRYDIFYKWILQFTVSLHWFNPFVYLMQNEINNLSEFSCDEIVISKLDSKSIKDYGNTLINAMNMAGNYKENLFSITLSKNKKLLKERLNAIMKYKKDTKTTIIFSAIFSIFLLLGTTFIGVYPINGKTTNANENKQYTFSQRYSANPEAYIGIKSIDNHWACSTSIEGNTYQEQLDNKLNYIESIYEQEKQMFIIEEGISLDEVTNIEGIKYMYDNSSIYRNLITSQNILYIAPEADFNILADDGQSILYERHSFYLDEAKELDLSISYKLDEGKMAVWVVSTDGKIIYQTETKNSFEQTIKQPLDKGIYSIVLVYEMDNGNLKGHKSIQGNFTSQNISNTSSNADIIDIKSENPPYLLSISGSDNGLVEVKLNLQSKIKDISNLKLTMEKDDDDFYPIFTKKDTITFDELNSGKGNFKTDKSIERSYPIKKDGIVDFNGLIDVTYMIDNPIDKNSSSLIPLIIRTPVKVISEIDGTYYWEAKDIVLYATTDREKQKITITISNEAQSPKVKTISENN